MDKDLLLKTFLCLLAHLSPPDHPMTLQPIAPKFISSVIPLFQLFSFCWMVFPCGIGPQQLMVWVVAMEPPVSNPLPSLLNPAFNFVMMQVLLDGPFRPVAVVS